MKRWRGTGAEEVKECSSHFPHTDRLATHVDQSVLLKGWRGTGAEEMKECS